MLGLQRELNILSHPFKLRMSAVVKKRKCMDDNLDRNSIIRRFSNLLEIITAQRRFLLLIRGCLVPFSMWNSGTVSKSEC